MTPDANLPSDFDGCKRGFQYAPAGCLVGEPGFSFGFLVPSREWGNGMILNTIQYLLTYIQLSFDLWIFMGHSPIDIHWLYSLSSKFGAVEPRCKDEKPYWEIFRDTFYWLLLGLQAAVIELNHVPLWLKSWWRRPVRVNDLQNHLKKKRNFGWCNHVRTFSLDKNSLLILFPLQFLLFWGNHLPHHFCVNCKPSLFCWSKLRSKPVSPAQAMANAAISATARNLLVVWINAEMDSGMGWNNKLHENII